MLRFRILKNNGLIFQSQVSYLIPIFGIILSYIFLGELITNKVLVSLCAVLVGLYFVKKRKLKKLFRLVISKLLLKIIFLA
ncbi:EamA family transporter [Candidatus Pelagibacter sp. Uisw_114]